MSDKMECDIVVENERTVKSGRWWKKEQKKRCSEIIKCKPLKSSWAKKMAKKAEIQMLKSKQAEIRGIIDDEKNLARQQRKEREERRKLNEQNAQIVQVISNPAKLKRAKKKQLKNIETRDTNPKK